MENICFVCSCLITTLILNNYNCPIQKIYPPRRYIIQTMLMPPTPLIIKTCSSRLSYMKCPPTCQTLSISICSSIYVWYASRVKEVSGHFSYTTKNSFRACLPTFKDDPFFHTRLLRRRSIDKGRIEEELKKRLDEMPNLVIRHQHIRLRLLFTVRFVEKNKKYSAMRNT